MKVLATFDKTISIRLDEQDKGIELLNLHYLNDKSCNIYDPHKKQLVSKYPEFEKEHPEFIEAHYAVHRTYTFDVKVELLENGRLRLVKT